MSDLAVIRNLDKRLAQEKARLLGELFDNIDGWRKAKRDFVTITRSYDKPGRHPADAQTLAAGDPRRQNAQAYTAYHRDEAVACAAILTALYLGEDDSR